MRPLGSIVLAAMLHGVPRALDSRAFGGGDSVYVDVQPADPELLGFARELEKAIAESALTLASRRSDAGVIIELLGVSRSEEGGGMEAARFALRDGPDTRPVILHYRPGHRAHAAHRLLEEVPRLDLG